MSSIHLLSQSHNDLTHQNLSPVPRPCAHGTLSHPQNCIPRHPAFLRSRSPEHDLEHPSSWKPHFQVWSGDLSCPEALNEAGSFLILDLPLVSAVHHTMTSPLSSNTHILKI